MASGLTLGEAIRRIRKRLGKNTTEFAALVGSTSSSISRYENGKLLPGMPVAMLLLNMAETAEEKTPLEQFVNAKKPVTYDPVEVPDNPIAEIRKSCRMAPAVFAAVVGCSEEDICELEQNGIGRAPNGVVERMRNIAVQHGRADLAVALGGEWAVRHVIHPEETLISSRKVDEGSAGDENMRIQPEDRQMWHDLLDEILLSGDQDAIIAVQHNLVVFGKTVRLSRKSQPRKKTG